MREQIARGILVVATNEQRDLVHCAATIDLNRFLRESTSHE